MNAIITVLLWFGSVFGVNTQQAHYQGAAPINHKPVRHQSYGVDQINLNPRTVVVLEDTHFKPSK